MPEIDIYHFIQQLINGLTIGSTYALIAIGYTMVYGIIGMINFAHGEVYMIGSYVAFIALAGLTMLGLDSLPLLITAAFVASIVVTSAYGYAIERVAYRPLRGSNRLIPLISAIGMSIFLQNTVLLAQDSKDKSIPNLIPGNFVFGISNSQEVVISYMQILIFIVTLVAMLALTWFISRSRLGRACRACAEDIKMANLLGINTNNIIALTFVIGAALAAVAAVLLSMQYGVINPNAGFLVGIKAFTAAVLGGIGSIPGAMLGGLVLGVAEAFGADVFGDQYKDVVAFALLVLVLLFRPTGLLGRPEVEKV
ncbi:MAG: branched-chain amino acid ABC-type transport system, permease component [Pseudomonas sp.]|jgi:branched-chain amino acid transport system permease protein|nr:branched-chain amino acid ABC-type transport system, permease component [Pseudomonas sp.]